MWSGTLRGNMKLEKLPFIAIGGCPRSGTTALTDLLNIDGSLFITREFRIFHCWQYPIGHQLIKYKLKSGRGSRRVFDQHNLNSLTLKSKSKTLNGKTIANFVTKKLPDLKYFGDKLPRHYLYFTNILAERFPNMKFIFCLRDGRSVIASQIRLSRDGKSKASFIAGSIPEAEYLWLDGCNYLEKNLNCSRLKGKVHLVRYEDAVRDPKKTVRKISKFLDIDKLDIEGHSYKPVHLDAWRKELPNMEDKLSKKFKKKLKRWGYE